ncbi:BF3164 family lipoprotein [Parabacteroides pacaensis]|uniref:BF3164 family lipoprotein n=1 Tax=Parabacteroides pacaensis TaxID=2086575 RepID=UPI000D10D40A|nr:6-bladed beta-propeller [Parabacteroides pacaensis]
MKKVFIIKPMLSLAFFIGCYGCSNNSQIEKHQTKRDNVINVQDKIKEIKTGDVLIGRFNHLSLINNYLIIGDYSTHDKLIHLFNKNNFNYITSTASRGQGPKEITNMGYIGVDEIHHKFYVTDHGKQRILSYELDSVLTDSLYIPTVKTHINNSQFPDRYQYINDTLCIGLFIKPTGNSGYNQFVGQWNMLTGEVKPMKYEHPDIEKKRINLAVSINKKIYIETYFHHDLMSICNLEGDLICNIYGPNWNNKKTNQILHYGNVLVCEEKIFALYLGEDRLSKGLPTKFLVFNLNGDYIKTIETGYQITGFCYDQKNKRLLMSLDDEIQFAYLNLDGII